MRNKHVDNNQKPLFIIYRVKIVLTDFLIRELVFINFPTREDILKNCQMLDDFIFIAKNAPWQTKPIWDQGKIRSEVKSLGRFLGWIECKREVILNNSGRCNIEIGP